MNLNYVVFVIPFFLAMIGAELLINKIKKGEKYRLNDAVTNLNIGIGEQVFSIFIKGLLLAVYDYLHKNYALMEVPNNLWTFIILFFLFDGIYYWAHRLGHEVNFMWAGHVVHHSSEEYNLTVALRQPWFQAFTTAFLFLPLAVIGFSVELFIVVSAIDIFYQFWIHTKYVPKMGKVIEFIFNTPSHHRVHHGIQPKYLDKNHGGMLIIWDRIFGTFQEEEEEPVYGITTPVNSWNPIWLNVHYFFELFKISAGFPKLKDKILNFFMPPGWRPASLGGRAIPTEPDKATYIKFETPLNQSAAIYSLLHFVLLIGMASALLFYQYDLTLLQLILLSAFIFYSMLISGALYENKSYAIYMELFRLILFPGLVFIIQIPFVFQITISVGFGIISIVSIWFVLSRKSEFVIKTVS